jgi:hypothetical protein
MVTSVTVRETFTPSEVRPVDPGTMCTLRLNIPRVHNPDENGRRKKVSFSNLRRTIRELRTLFSGYTIIPGRGWNREDGIRDLFYCVEVDFFPTRDLLAQLVVWKEELRLRFDQNAFYMRISEGTKWV